MKALLHRILELPNAIDVLDQQLCALDLQVNGAWCAYAGNMMMTVSNGLVDINPALITAIRVRPEPEPERHPLQGGPSLAGSKFG